ncbi:MAG: hypothetical protein E7490_08885 [Ruminococcaceae bacterium]|nr:hypothetical protein [Oscillospiraceae bacterium]
MEIAKVAEQAAINQTTIAKTNVQTTTEKANSTLASDNADKYVKSDEMFTPAYTKKSAQKKDVENSEVKFNGSVAQTKADHLTSVVENLIAHQAEKHGAKKNVIELSGALKEQLEEITGKKPEGIEGAETETEDYWGAEATAMRIFEFAKSLSGDNVKYADTLRDAFIKGFGLAAKTYGGKDKLPGVCGETYDRVMELFDEWQNPKTEESDEAVKVEASADTEAAAQ